MRIAMLSNAAVVHTARWVERLRARGHEVRLWSLERGAGPLGAEALPRLPLPGALRYPLAAPALRRALAGFRPELVLAHFVPNYGVLGALGGWHPLVVAAWGSDLLRVAGRDPLQRARARFVLGRADLVLADSENLAAAARAFGAAPAKVVALPWGVDLARFQPGAAREPGLIVSTRMHEPVYDLPTVIEAAGRVLRERPETRLVLAGDGSRRASLERLAARRLPPGRFAFVGRIAPAELAGWLGRAAVAFSAARSDSTSVSLLEAMACGALPVVCDLEGNREWVGEGEGARLFRPGDADDAARALRAALDDPAWAERARARNRAVVEARADWDANMGRVESLLEALARRGPMPARAAGGAT
ncbi:MAG TPA: glycosyltransferase [Candidatus Eisenbacteria bacterium]